MNNANDIRKAEMCLTKISMEFLKNNYDYIWLKAMLCKAGKLGG